MPQAYIPIRVQGSAPDGTADRFGQLAFPSLGAPTAAQITSALGYTPYDSGNPTGYVTTAGARSAIGAGANLAYDPSSGQMSLSSVGVTSALTYTPANRAGDTFGGPIKRDANFAIDLLSGNPLITYSPTGSFTYDRTGDQHLFTAGGNIIASISAAGLGVNGVVSSSGQIRRDSYFYLDLYSGTNPFISFSADGSYTYDRTNKQHLLTAGGVVAASVSAAGLGVAGTITAGGAISRTSSFYIDLFSGNPFISFSAAGSLIYSLSNDQMLFTAGGTIRASISSSGVGVNGGLNQSNGVASLWDVNISPQQSLLIYPQGNALATQASFSMQLNGTSSNANNREFAEVVTFHSSYGSGGTSGNDKVTSYRSMWVDQGSSDAWVDNPLLYHSTDDFVNTHVCESDYDMISKNRYGTAVGGAGLSGGTDKNGNAFSSGSAWGHVMTGLSTNGGTITGGFGVAAAGSNPLFQRGFVSAQGVIQSGFEDDGTSQVAFRDCGSHTDGLNTENAVYSRSAVMIKNGHKISSKNASGTATNMLWMNAGNLQLGDGAAALISAGASLVPASDNSLTLGQSGLRWASVWSANGSIQTSQASLKTDIAEVDPAQASAFIDALTPKSYRWISGGKRAVITDDGEAALEDVAGKRLHFGVLACDVKAAYEASGFEDFGGYVVGEDGTEGIRPDQILAIALAEIRSLRGRIAKLESVSANN